MALTYPHDYKSKLAKCVIRIEDHWYDCTAWRHTHPGGAQIIDKFHEVDATDAFFSIHSVEAIAKLSKMKSRPVSSTVTERSTVSRDFAELRHRLEREGWFQRNWWREIVFNLLPLLLMVVVGSWISRSHSLLATVLIGLAMQQAGWVGHDHTHGRGKISLVFSAATAGLINGFSPRWWSHKHNMHHTFPNRKEFDSDIHNEPILHLWFPSKENDKWFRRYQHLYFPLAYSFLYLSWRIQSLQFALGSKDSIERTLIAVNYMWLACLPYYVSIGSILLGGLFVAIVVTVNHQTEEVIETDSPYDFVVDQFRSTRGVACPDAFSEYFFGGLQYQLEHHLFPTMPKERYPKLRPIINQFAQDHKLQCHLSGISEIIRLNYEVMKKFSQ